VRESDVESATSQSLESGERSADESGDQVEEEDYSEAEETDSGDEDEDIELSPEQQEALTNRLLRLRALQSGEVQAFIARVEAEARAKPGSETPDDYVFTRGK
jgi:hypothetical protein